MIIADSNKYSHDSISVKKIIPMRKYCTLTGEWSEPYDYEILINRSKNFYFSMELYFKGESWVKQAYVLNGLDKRLKVVKNENNQITL